MKYTNPIDTVLTPADHFTAKATTDVKGGTFATFAAGGVDRQPNVTTANATTPVVGVFKYDAKAGEPVGIGRYLHASVVAGEALVAGDGIVSGATGKAAKAGVGVHPIGVAYTPAAADAAVYIQFS